MNVYARNKGCGVVGGVMGKAQELAPSKASTESSQG